VLKEEGAVVMIVSALCIGLLPLLLQTMKITGILM